jgi:type III restriction enzyme
MGDLHASVRASATGETPSGRRPIQRRKGIEKSLIAPFYEAMVDNPFEQDFACYLDSQQAVRWWHRNVARSGYGLQGWRRHRVYPDFVFMRAEHDGRDTPVVMESKDAHLSNEDTEYRTRLLAELERAFRDERMHRAGELEVVDGPGERLVCGLVFDENRKNEVYFGCD